VLVIAVSDAAAIGEEIVGRWRPSVEIIERHYSHGRQSGAYKCHSRKNRNVGSPPPLFCHDVKPSPSQKVVIGVVLAAIAAVIMTNLIATKIETTRLTWQATFRDYTRIGGPQFWSKVEKSLDDLANPKSELPEDKRQKILSDIRAIRDRWWPFIAEAVPADAKSK
jgi:hypothetical protein